MRTVYNIEWTEVGPACRRRPERIEYEMTSETRNGWCTLSRKDDPEEFKDHAHRYSTSIVNAWRRSFCVCSDLPFEKELYVAAAMKDAWLNGVAGNPIDAECEQ